MYDCRLMIGQRKIWRTMCGLFLSVLLLISAGCASTSGKKDTDPAIRDSQKMITGIKTVVAGDAERVVISANKQLQYTSVKQNNPLGILLLFPETTFQEDLNGDLNPTAADNKNIVSTITASKSPDQKNTRLEIGLNRDVPHEIIKNGMDLEISFPQQNPAMAQTSDEDTSPAMVSAEETRSGMTASTSSEMSPEAISETTVAHAGVVNQPTGHDTNRKPAIINRIDFSTQASGKSMVVVGTADAAIDFDIMTMGDRALKVRLFNTQLPEYRKNRPLITTRFESAVDRISPVQAADANATDLIIELREMVPYRPVVEDNILTIHFDPSSIGPRPFEAANLPSWQQVMENAAATDFDETLSPMTLTEEKDPYADLLDRKKEYTGQKIALDFYKTDIKNVFKILQQVSGKNYAVDKDVNGEVTISLERPVPWDQVLDLILDMNQLGKVEQGDIIRIATTATLSAEEQAKQKKIQAIRERMEEQKTLEPLVTEYLPINYASAKSEILPHIEGLLSKDRGSITIDGRNNQVIMTDTQAVLSKAKEIIAEIDKVTPQVLIEARIVEMSDDFSREFGVEWTASGDDIYKSGLDGKYSYQMAMNLPGLNTLENRAEEGLPGGSLGFSFQRLDAWGTPILLDATLRSMEKEGQGKIISSPKVLTLDNKTAMIRQGVRIPFTVIEDGSVEVEFQDVDLLLEVTPHITPDKRVSLEIKTNKNEIIGFADFLGYPIISTNEAETVLLVDDGETIVIGGVTKIAENTLETGLPVLKDIPMLGWLFKTNTSDSTTNELLVFLTPRIVQLEQKSLVQAEN